MLTPGVREHHTTGGTRMTTQPYRHSLGDTFFDGSLYQPITLRATLAIIGVAITTAADAITTVMLWTKYDLMRDYATGTVTLSHLADQSDRGTPWNIPLVLISLAGPIAGLVWLWRARTNAEWLGGPHSQRLLRGWTVGGWICPIVNFWYPYRIVADIWRASATRRPARTTWLLSWWLLYVAATFTGFYAITDGQIATAALNLVIQRSATTEHAISLLHETAQYSTVSTGLHAVAGALFVLVILRITNWQTTPRDPDQPSIDVVTN